MPDEKTVLKQKGTGSTWNKVYLCSSTDIVERPNSEKNAEETFTEIENILHNKVDGTFRLYHSLNEISLTAGSETIQSIIDGMQNNSIMALPVGSGYNAGQYPAANGTLLIVKITQEFAMAFFQQVNVNSLHTGVYYKSVSTSQVTWTGWRDYETTPLEYDSTPTADSTKLVNSGAIYTALEDLQTALEGYADTADANLSKTLNGAISALEGELTSHTGDSTRHITSTERQTWNGKQNQLTFDSTPTSGSTNPVTSQGILNALNQKAASNHNHDGTYVKKTDVGANGGVTPLGADGKIDAQYLPSYVDDVIEGTLTNTTTFTSGGSAVTPETGKIYVDTTTNKSYRWSGSRYTEIGGGVALGETSSTAYRGDRGKVAYEHSQITGANPHGITPAIIGAAEASHNHNASDINAGTLPIARGGTGASDAATARTNLEITPANIGAAASSHTHSADQVQVSGGSNVEEALEAKISHTDEFTAEMQDLHGNARGLLCTVPSYAGPDIASINAPPDVNWGTCLSLQVGSIRTLMLIDSSGLWIQYYNGTSWSAWQKMLSAGITGTLAITNGGTGATTAAKARTNLGVINIQVSSSQPTNQSNGDLWFETIS